MKEQSLQHFFDGTEIKALLSNDEKLKIAAYSSATKEPVFIKILIGAGGWVASLFIMAFVMASGIVGDEFGALILGLGGLFTGIFLKKIPGTFASQVSLALVATGHFLILFAAVNINNSKDITICLIIHGILVSLLYPFYKSSIYRFLAPMTVGFIAFFWMQDENLTSVFHVLVLCQLCCISLLFLRHKKAAALRPLAFSGLFFLPLLFILHYSSIFDVFDLQKTITIWPSTILVAGGLILLSCHFSEDWRQSQLTRVSILITIGLALFTTPAILTAIGLFILGHGLQRTLITALAYTYMPLALTGYYYFMGVDLAQKSWIMAASGLLLLMARYILDRLPQPKEDTP